MVSNHRPDDVEVEILVGGGGPGAIPIDSLRGGMGFEDETIEALDERSRGARGCWREPAVGARISPAIHRISLTGES